MVGAASAVVLAAGSIYYLRRGDDDITPPTMTKAGEATNNGLLVKRRTVDYESILREALIAKVSLVTMTLTGDAVRDQHLENSIRYSPFPSSRAHVRVKYHVEYVIGFPLEADDFRITREGSNLIVRVRRPQLVARPSVKLLSYEVLESGFLVDEKTAIIELQRRLQPEAERRGRKLVTRASVMNGSEQALRKLLQAVVDKADPDADPPPRVVIRYR